VINLRDENRVSTLPIRGLEPPRPPAPSWTIATAFAGAERRELRPTLVRAEKGTIRLAVEITLPFGYKINNLAPMTYLVERIGTDTTPALFRPDALGKPVRLDNPSRQFEISLPVTAAAGEETLQVGLDYYYCREGAEGVCKTGSIVWTVPVQLSEMAETALIPLAHRVR
jgi:hypothetical protein